MSEKPAARKLFVTAATIEEYCIAIIIKGMEGTATPREVEESLLLRVQTGRSHRHVNLPGGLTFADTGSDPAASDGTPVPHLNIVCTKPLGQQTVEGFVNAKGKVKLLLTDAVTAALWRMWSEQEWDSDVPKHEAFVFPKQHQDSFAWDQPMTRSQHDKAVQRCARTMNLALTEEEVQSRWSLRPASVHEHQSTCARRPSIVRAVGT